MSTGRLAAPTGQFVTANIDTNRTGTLVIVFEIGGTAVGGITSIGRLPGGTGGYGYVVPRDPNLLGTGTHTGTVTVKACMDDPTCATGQLRGSPQTVSVTYAVQAPQPSRPGLYPHVWVSGSDDELVLRGTGFSGVTSVSFGSTPAASFTIVSDTEIHARPSAMTPGQHPVSLNSGAHSYSEQLTVIAPMTHAAELLPYPAPTPASGLISRVRYDAKRRAALVTLRTAASADSRLVRYTHDGTAWSNPQVASIAGLRDVIVGPAGDTLLGYTSLEVLEIDPVTLAVTGTYPVTGAPGRYIRGIALGNDGNAFLKFACSCSSGSEPIYFYDTATHALRQVAPGGDFLRPGLDASGERTPVLTASADGGKVFIGPYSYIASTGSFGRSGFGHSRDGNNWWPLYEMDTHGTRLSLSDLRDDADNRYVEKTDVFDASYQRLGRILGVYLDSFEYKMSAVSPDGRRIHLLEFNLQQHAAVRLVTFDVSSDQPSAQIPQLSSVPLSSLVMTDTSPGVTITPDGRTLLLPGDGGIYVQPIP